jgi:predicted DNA-binding transcriptional regulator AlpA
MKSRLLGCNAESDETHVGTRVTLSPWVNEQALPWSQILTARDVARLTRRRRWICVGLMWFGRFPRRKTYRGRAIGWLKSEVLEWMTRGLRLSRCDSPQPMPPGAGFSAHQHRLPLDFCIPCTRRRRRHRRANSQQKPTSGFCAPYPRRDGSGNRS